MATNKAKRSNPLAQPARRSCNPQPKRSQRQINDPQLKSHLFETLSHLNRGFGVALAAFDRLQKQESAKTGNLPTALSASLRNRAQEIPSSPTDLLGLCDEKTAMPNSLRVTLTVKRPP